MKKIVKHLSFLIIISLLVPLTAVNATSAADTSNEITDTPSMASTVTLPTANATGIVDNAEYYIMNYASERLMALETQSDTNGTDVVTLNRVQSPTLSKWKVIKNSDGTYTFESVYSPTSKVLTNSDGNINMCTATNSLYQKFTICRSNVDGYKGLYQILCRNEYVVQYGSTTDVQTSNNGNSSSYWSFIAVDKRDADIFSHNYVRIHNGDQEQFDTTQSNVDFVRTMSNLGFNAPCSWINENAEFAYDFLTDLDDVFVYYGHGRPSELYFALTNEVHNGSIKASVGMGGGSDTRFISKVPENGLSRVRMVLYTGCNTGDSYHTFYNLVDMTIEKGAHFALGWTEVMYTSTCTPWLIYFFDAIDSGYNIMDSIDYANETTGRAKIGILQSDNTYLPVYIEYIPLYYSGDASQYLNLPN